MCLKCKINKEEKDFSGRKKECRMCSNERSRILYKKYVSLPKQPLNLNDTKVCTSCGEKKLLSDFYIRWGLNIPMSKCKMCKSNDDKKRRENLTEDEKKAGIVKRKLWVDKQSEEMRNGNIKVYMMYKLASYKSQCKKYNIPFDLDVNYLIELMEKQRRKCYYTGVPLTMKSNRGLKLGRKSITLLSSKSQASLDRVEPEKGYVKGNVVWCGWMVNTCKNMLTESEFYDICKQVITTKNIQV